jgi:hypothetical protein
LKLLELVPLPVPGETSDLFTKGRGTRTQVAGLRWGNDAFNEVLHAPK